MIRFQVIKEASGWAVIMGEATRAPFRSRGQAISEAKSLAEALAKHGQMTTVIIEASADQQTRAA